VGGKRDDLDAIGTDMCRAVWGDKYQAIAQSLEELDPDLAALVRRFAYGAVYSRPGLGLKERELIAVALLVAGGHTAQLLTHLHGALHTGATPQELKETLLHCIPYVGFPPVLEALPALHKVLQRRRR